jgi:hypothetical protein
MRSIPGGAITAPEQSSPRLVSTRTTPGVAIHEWMHVLGLGHVGDPEQQMYWRDTCKGSLGTGDLAGLLAISQPLR